MKDYLISTARKRGLSEKQFDLELRSLQLFTREEEKKIIAEYNLSPKIFQG